MPCIYSAWYITLSKCWQWLLWSIRGWKKGVFINGSNRAKTMICQNIFRKKRLETIISIHLQPSHLSTHPILKQDLKSLWKLHTHLTVSSKKRKSQMFLSWGGWELCKTWELSYSHLTPKEAGFAPYKSEGHKSVTPGSCGKQHTYTRCFWGREGL